MVTYVGTEVASIITGRRSRAGRWNDMIGRSSDAASAVYVLLDHVIVPDTRLRWQGSEAAGRVHGCMHFP